MLPPGRIPDSASARTPGRTGTAATSSTASTRDAAAIFIRCPSSPKPVTSVQPVAPAVIAARAAAALLAVIDATAAATRSSGAAPTLIAVVVIPMPSGLVSTSASPSRRPELRRIRSGCASPTTASPYLGSGSSTLCPPTTANPPSAAISAPPASTSASRDIGRSDDGHATRFSANSGRPPIA